MRNQSTGRCRSPARTRDQINAKRRAATRSKPCGEGKVRDIKSGRCRNKKVSKRMTAPARRSSRKTLSKRPLTRLSGGAKSQKKCKPGYERDGKTNRCLSTSPRNKALRDSYAKAKANRDASCDAWRRQNAYTKFQKGSTSSSSASSDEAPEPRRRSPRLLATGKLAGGMMKRVGTKHEVYHGKAKLTAGGLTKMDLKPNAQGKIVSKKQSAIGKERYRQNGLALYKAANF